jgi:SWIM/SEC-C metal-binding protein
VASIGSRKNPAIVRVQTVERAQRLMDWCKANDIQCIVGVEPDKSEDISDIDRALKARQPVDRSPKIGRNDPCPCGSGKKYKKCCATHTVQPV